MDEHARIDTGDYDLELPKLFAEIERTGAKRVLLQLPDGLKQYADRLLAAVRSRYPDVVVVLWSGSCYGACDAPLHARNLGFDLLVQFGHSPWRH